MKPSETNCDACKDDGFLLVNNDVHGVRIEKCDNCDACKTDAEANEKVFRLACKAQDALDSKNKALTALKTVQAQFAGYALRIAPSDFGNDIILGDLEKAIGELEKVK